jgi:L-aspartate oxidase
VHGANRLASNSLLEGLVFAERVARDMVATPRSPVSRRVTKSWDVPPLGDRGAAQVSADSVRTLMWEHAAIDRNARGLRKCLAALNDLHGRLDEGMTEERNMCETARLVASAALARRESRGGHYRSDFPKAKGEWRGKHIEW